jgi:hypothetical protein
VVVVPAVGDVEQAPAGDERSGAAEQISQHLRARLVDGERHVLVGALHGHLSPLVPVEELADLVVGLGDVSVERHRHVRPDLAHRAPPSVSSA